MPVSSFVAFVPAAFAIDVRDFSLFETVVLALVVAFGIALLTWLLAGYYERRGGFGKR